MGTFKLTATAKNDLRRIAAFTERRWGRDQRNNYLRQLDQAFYQLASNAEIGRACEYIKPGYRKFPFASHVIYYRSSDPDCVEIIRVLHKQMDVSRALSKS